MRGAVVKHGKGHCVPLKCQDMLNYTLHNVTSQKMRFLNIMLWKPQMSHPFGFFEMSQKSFTGILVLISVHLIAARARDRGDIS
jgi:hypothetical protein